MDDQTRIRHLLAEVQRLSDEHWRELDQPLRAMREHAWVGPSAAAFARDLEQNHRLLQARLSASVEAVRARLNGVP